MTNIEKKVADLLSKNMGWDSFDVIPDDYEASSKLIEIDVFALSDAGLLREELKPPRRKVGAGW